MLIQGVAGPVGREGQHRVRLKLGGIDARAPKPAP
jgi:hypothetical protein